MASSLQDRSTLAKIFRRYNTTEAPYLTILAVWDSPTRIRVGILCGFAASTHFPFTRASMEYTAALERQADVDQHSTLRWATLPLDYWRRYYYLRRVRAYQSTDPWVENSPSFVRYKLQVVLILSLKCFTAEMSFICTSFIANLAFKLMNM